MLKMLQNSTNKYCNLLQGDNLQLHSFLLRYFIIVQCAFTECNKTVSVCLHVDISTAICYYFRNIVFVLVNKNKEE